MHQNSYRIALIFRGSLISRILRISNHLRNYFSENFDIGDIEDGSISVFTKVDGNYPGTKLPDPQGALSKEVPSSSISAANTEIAAVLQPSAAGVPSPNVS